MSRRANVPPVIAFLVLSGCSPTPNEVPEGAEKLKPLPYRHLLVSDQIESKMKDEPCIGDIDRWIRLYDFESNSRVVSIELFESGIHGRPPGRFVLEANEFRADDRDFRLAFAQYDQVSEALTVTYCGRNTP